MLEQVENAERSVWGSHTHLLEDTTHVVGGIGLGLLLYSVLPKEARNVGFGLLALSALGHVYALTTSRSRPFG